MQFFFNFLKREKDSQKREDSLNKSDEECVFNRLYTLLKIWLGVFVKCPFCNHQEIKVTDSRDAAEINAIRRRRECCLCLKRFTTFETVDLSLQVKKRDGTFEDFQQEKLMSGMDAACRHTRVSHDQTRAITDTIKADLMARGVREISSQELGDMVMTHLQKTDVVAYIRFVCVYKRFKDIQELVDAIQSIAPVDALKEPESEESIHGVKEK